MLSCRSNRDDLVKHVPRQPDSGGQKFLIEFRQDSRRRESADDLPFGREAALFKYEDFLQGHDVGLNPGDFRDTRHAACAIAHAGSLYQDVNGGGDLLPDGRQMHVGIGQRHHQLQTPDGIPGGIGVDRGQGAIVAGIHGLEHVERLFAANLSDDDAVRPHAQAVDQQLPLAHRALPFDIGGAGLEPRHVRLFELQFGRILDGDDALLGGDEDGKSVEQGRFTRARTARDDDIEPRLDGGFEQAHHSGGKRVLGHQILRHQLVGAETADGQQWPIHGKRGDDGVDARSIGQTRIYHGIRFIHAATDLGDDPVDDAQQVAIVVEGDIGQLQKTAPFHVNLFMAVHQDVRDRRVLEQRLKGTQAEDLMQDFTADLLLLGGCEKIRLAIHNGQYGLAYLLTYPIVIYAGEGIQIDPIEELAMQRELELLILGLQFDFSGGITQQPLFPIQFRQVVRAYFSDHFFTFVFAGGSWAGSRNGMGMTGPAPTPDPGWD